jgi:hypothetical protein
MEVGSTRYTADNGVSTAGFHVVAIDREDASLKVHMTVPATESLSSAINGPIASNCTGDFGCVVIISSLRTIGPTPCPVIPLKMPTNCNYAEPGTSISSFGGSTRINFVDGTNPVNSFSMITTVGPEGTPWRGNGQADERLACEAGSGCYSDLGIAPNIWTGYGDITGALVLDSNNALAFTRISRPSVLLAPTPNASDTNTITIGSQTYSASLPSGATGGFHVVICDASALGLSLNDAFPITPDGLSTMATAIGNYRTSTQNVLVFVTSIGDLGHANAAQQWLQVANVLSAYGATYQLFASLDSGDDYSMIGNPGTSLVSVPTVNDNSTEVSSIISRAASTLPPIPSNISGVLKKNRLGYYRPLLSSATSQFATSNPTVLDQIALQTPIAWPFTPEENVCTGGDSTSAGQLNAYQAVSYYLSGNADGNFGVPDVRSTYTITGTQSVVSGYKSTLATTTFQLVQSQVALYEKNNPAVNLTTLLQFNATDFCNIQAQVGAELQYAAAVQIYQNALHGTLASNKSNLQAEIGIVYTDLASKLQVNTSSSDSTAADILGAVAGALSIASYVTPIGPEGQLALDAASVGLSYGLSLDNDSNGAPVVADELRSTFADLMQSTINQFAAGKQALDNMFTLVLEDWGRLKTLGPALVPNADNPNSVPDIDWSSDNSNLYVNATYKAMAKVYVNAFLGTLYQLYTFPYISSGQPPAGNLNDVCALYDVDLDLQSCPLGDHFDASDWINIMVAPDGNAPSTSDDGSAWTTYLIAGNAGITENDYSNGSNTNYTASGSYPPDSAIQEFFMPSEPLQPDVDPTDNLGIYPPWFFLKSGLPNASLTFTQCYDGSCN